MQRPGSLAAAQEEVTSVNEDIDDDTINPKWGQAQVARDDDMALDHAFKLFDADGDGKLTEAEVIAALTRKTGQGTELSEEVARATWRRWQYEFDIDNDGTISYKEMRKRRNEVNQARATANALTPGNA